jgi:AcrR family transcriptional regulator
VRLPGKAGLHEQIVQATIELGSELGEEGLTMRAIAARLGVSSTVLYQHFDSKAAILREIELYGIRMLRERLMVAEGPTPTEHLVAMSECYVNFALANPWLYRVLFTGHVIDWDELDPEQRDELLGPLTIVREFLETGKRTGRLGPSLDVEHAAMTLWAAMHGVATMLLDGRISAAHPVFPVHDVGRFVRAYVESVVRGLESRYGDSEG